MVVISKKGNYELMAVFKDAFNQELFEEAYIEELFDKYPYIVGDLSDGLLRLKGFSLDPKKPNYFKNIKLYIEKSCAFECPYYILRRIKDKNEITSLKETKPNVVSTPSHLTIEKENFDKETLVLETSKKNRPNIVLDLNRINNVPIGKLPQDLKTEEEKEDNTTSVVASDGFVPVKRDFNSRNRKRDRR